MRLICLLLLLLLINLSFALTPNVLLIVVDDLRPALGIYNDPNAVTPNIDKLAKTSFIFKNAFAQQALCAPSRNSFLTSRRPDSLHLYDFYSYWRHSVGNFTTLPQHFKENGYVTHSIGKVFHPGISSNHSDDCPYSWSYKPFHPKTEIYKNDKVCMDANGKLGTNYVCPVRVADHPGHTLPDIECLDAAVEFLQGMKRKSSPFFLSVGFQKPHIPLKFPREFLESHPLNKIEIPKNHYKPPLMPTVAWNPWTDVRERDDIKKLRLDFPFGVMPSDYLKLLVQSYAASVSYVDDLIGQLLSKVNLGNTIVVLLGDHGLGLFDVLRPETNIKDHFFAGVSMGEHGEFSKYSNFDIATRVPFIVYVPNFSNRSLTSEKIVELLDLFPTLVDLTGVSSSLEKCPKNGSKIKLCTEGKSLVRHMVNLQRNNITQDGSPVAISQYPRPQVYPKRNPNSDKPKLKEINIMGYSIRDEICRYTEWVQFNPHSFHANWSKIYAKELYFHRIDPDENLNLAMKPEMKDIMEDLHKKLLLSIGIDV